MTCVTPSGRPRWPSWAVALGLPVLACLCLATFRIDPAVLTKGPQNLGGFLGKTVSHFDWAYVPALTQLTVETVAIALVASVFGCLVAFPLACLAALTTTPHPAVAYTVKAAASVVRTLPDLVLALVLASAVGLGPVPGVVALVVTGAAYLVKAYAEVLEVVDPKPVEGVRATGGDWLSQRTIGVIPQGTPDLVGLSLYIVDSNLRSASILGAVGAGGIGFDLANALKHFRFDRIGLIVFSIYLTVSLVDLISTWVRRRMA